RMKKRCLSCGVQFTLSGSGKRQKYCPKCARRNDRRGEEVYWRVNIAEAERPCGFSEPREATSDVIRIEGNSHVHLTRLKPNPPARDPRCILPDIWPR